MLPKRPQTAREPTLLAIPPPDLHLGMIACPHGTKTPHPPLLHGMRNFIYKGTTPLPPVVYYMFFLMYVYSVIVYFF